MSEIYVSTDIESDGPIPGPNSMLSLGSAAFHEDKRLIGTFSANFNLLEGATGSKDTMEFWAQHPEEWKRARENPEDPTSAMKRYHRWLKDLPGTPVFVGYPAGYDFLFVYWYLIKFAGDSPFSFSAIDIKSYAMALLKKPFRETTKRNFPRHWFSKLPHTHVAVEDAAEQGLLFLNMVAENKKTPAPPDRWDMIS